MKRLVSYEKAFGLQYIGPPIVGKFLLLPNGVATLTGMETECCLLPTVLRRYIRILMHCSALDHLQRKNTNTFLISTHDLHIYYDISQKAGTLQIAYLTVQ